MTDDNDGMVNVICAVFIMISIFLGILLSAIIDGISKLIGFL